MVSYRADDAAARILAFAPEGVDRIVEVAPAANAELDAAVAAPDAVVSFYANEGGGELTVPIRRFMTANLTLRGVLVYTMPAAALQQAVADVSAAVAAGALTTLPLHRFPLERIADAHDAVEQRRGRQGRRRRAVAAPRRLGAEVRGKPCGPPRTGSSRAIRGSRARSRTPLLPVLHCRAPVPASTLAVPRHTSKERTQHAQDQPDTAGPTQYEAPACTPARRR